MDSNWLYLCANDSSTERKNKFKMRRAHGEWKRRLFIHGLNLKLRWHRKERTICSCCLPSPFEKDDGRTHMKSLFYQSELIRRISSDTKQKRHENASTTNITLDHFGEHISGSAVVECCVWTWLGIFCGCYMGFEKWSWVEGRKGKLQKISHCPI